MRQPWHFKPGQSGNPKGRAKGSRNKLGEDFIHALHDDFQEHGIEVIKTVRADRPHDYLKIVASLMPKQLEMERQRSIHELTDEELNAILVDSLAAPAEDDAEEADAEDDLLGPDVQH